MTNKKRREKVQIAGHQTPRDRMWTIIRANPDDFTLVIIERDARINYNSANGYIQCLLRAGIVEKTYEEQRKPQGFKPGDQFFSLIHYKLVKDTGVSAPRITREGDRVTHRDHRQAMWTTLRININTALDANTLAAFSSTPEMEVSESSARQYMKILHLAGYLEMVHRGKQRQSRTTYRLRPLMNTGPRSPWVQSAQRVFDPNLDKAMYQERPEMDDERRDGTGVVDDRTSFCVALSGPLKEQGDIHGRMA